MLPKAVLFDLDGTLINSEMVHYSGWTELLSRYGKNLDLEYYETHFTGVSINENAQRVKEVFGLPLTVEELIHTKEQIYRGKIRNNGVPMMPYALEALEYFYGRGISIGLVTSSARAEVEIVLPGSGLARFFDVTITRDDVKNPKPDGEPYAKAARALGFASSEYLVFEDTATGVAAAKNAGLRVYAVQSQHEMKARLGAADRIFDDLKAALDSF